jgi:HK97 family phage major capsid protein
MPWTVENPPDVAKNWTEAQKEKCVSAANQVLADGGSDEDAIFACISAAGKSEQENSKMEIIEKMKLPMMYRAVEVSSEEINNDKRTVELSFSSEEPVERWWGTEILDHSKKSVILNRLKTGGAVLVNHNTDDQVGVVEKVKIDEDERKGRATVRFGRSQRAQEIFQDIADGIRRNVSVGYIIHEIVLEKKTDDLEIYRATSWEPMEISTVPIPADVSVGVGRSESGKEFEVLVHRGDGKGNIPSHIVTAAPALKMEDSRMDVKDRSNPAEHAAGKRHKEQESEEETISSKVSPEPEPAKPSASAMEMEKGRQRAIRTLCKINNLDENMEAYWVGSGISIDEVAEDILKIKEERGKSGKDAVTRLGLGDREKGKYSFCRAIQAAASKEWNKAPFELECSRVIADKLQKAPDPHKFYVPFDVLEKEVDMSMANMLRRQLGMSQRDLTVGTAGAGGYLVATDNVGFIEMLRNRSVALRMGVRRLSGLSGNVTIPRQSAAATAYWLATEATQITESQQTFVQVALSPKTVGAYTEISRLLLLQSSPGAEGIVTDDIAQVVATAADLAVLNGAGAAGEPLGIIGTGGIGSVSGTTLGYAGILEFQTDVATSNVMPIRGGYVTTPAVASLMMQRARFSNTDTPLWVGNIWDGSMAGFPSMSSNQMPSANMLFGDWQEAILAEWGVLEVEVNPYANFQAGIVGVRAMYSLDVGVRRAFAFSLATTIT